MQKDKVYELVAETCGEVGAVASEEESAFVAKQIDDPFLFIETLVQLALEDDDEDETLEDMLASGVIREADYEVDEDGRWTLVFKKEHLE